MTIDLDINYLQLNIEGARRQLKPDGRQTRELWTENTGTEGFGAKAALRAALKRMKDDFRE